MNNYVKLGLGLGVVGLGTTVAIKTHKNTAQYKRTIDALIEEGEKNDNLDEVKSSEYYKSNKKRLYLERLRGGANAGVELAIGGAMVASAGYALTKDKLPTKLTNKVDKISFKINAHKPEIMLAGAIVGVTATAALSIYAYEKTRKHVIEFNETVANIKKAQETSENYTEDDYIHDMKFAKTELAYNVVADTTPAVIAFGLTVSSICGVYTTLKTTVKGLTAAYLGVQEKFREYRDQVIADYGEDVDLAYISGGKMVEKKAKVTDEDGKTSVKKAKVLDKDSLGTVRDTTACVTRIFDSSNELFEGVSAQLNCLSIRGKLTQLDVTKRQRGWITLNEVLEMYAFEPNIEFGYDWGWTDDMSIDLGINLEEIQRKYDGFAADDYNIPFVFSNMVYLKNAVAMKSKNNYKEEVVNE